MADGVGVVKVRAVGGSPPQAPNALGPEERAFQAAGALTPRYDPSRLYRMYEESAALRPNIDAYATNIHGFGFQFEPTIDLESSDATTQIREALILERMFDGELPSVTPEEVEAKRYEVESTMRVEKIFLDAWFSDCTSDISFLELWERTRTDLEVTGNAYWECLRTESGRLAEFNGVPAVSMRLLPVDQRWTELAQLKRVSALGYRRQPVRRRLRLYVQIADGVDAVWFKELGDPRTFSARTGRRYRSIEALREAEGCEAAPATELLHFRLFNPLSAYGVPRWIGAMPAVLGSRESEEVNVMYFADKCIPPMALTVEGGVLADGAVERIEETIRDKVKGAKNFHSLLILEASAPTTGLGIGPSVAPKIHLQPLSQFQQQDALFQAYEANNTEKVGQQFRLPRLLRGQMNDFNRATAESALQYAEQQVFQPERSKVDHVVNKRILSDLNIRFWRFKSAGPVVRDPPALMEMLAKAGFLTVEEARQVAAEVFGREFKPLDADWVQGPVAALQRGAGASQPAEIVRNLVELRAAVEAREQQQLSSATDTARSADAAEEIEVPASEFRSWFAPPPKAS